MFCTSLDADGDDKCSTEENEELLCEHKCLDACRAQTAADIYLNIWPFTCYGHYASPQIMFYPNARSAWPPPCWDVSFEEIRWSECAAKKSGKAASRRRLEMKDAWLKILKLGDYAAKACSCAMVLPTVNKLDTLIRPWTNQVGFQCLDLPAHWLCLWTINAAPLPPELMQLISSFIPFLY